jgi:type I restriction enzyme, R subunit
MKKIISYEDLFIKSNSDNLNESETRKIIDFKLNLAGWTADTEKINYRNGSRPVEKKFLAIAEWPTASGPADYILFDGLRPIATVEAKRKNIDVVQKLDQAIRYADDFNFDVDSNFNKIPFAFSTNGRVFNKILPTKSGIWFKDLSKKNLLSRPIKNFFSPKGLLKILDKSIDESKKKLEIDEFNYDYDLRYYQKQAIQKVEEQILNGKKNCLLSMATGTGKTKTALAFIYRALNSGLFNNILYVVDRNFLGSQAFNQFANTKIVNDNSLNQIFEILPLNKNETETTKSNCKIITIQSLLKKTTKGKLNDIFPTIDEFDCIIVDECHRGYILDKEIDEENIIFNNEEDYLSSYRNALEYFDAFKVGLTATPALHTVDIFGDPVYSYSYRTAVLDGFLVDHLPPIKITTENSKHGIHWGKNEKAHQINRRTGETKFDYIQDKLNFEVSTFNKQVITHEFNKTIANKLLDYIDPYLDEKTLIFCCLDEHADIMVHEIKQAIKQKYGSVDEGIIEKITGSIDNPKESILKFKNEKFPNIAVTVDLLTTGVDIEKICNLVFVRRVNSRILFEQMMGRATRLCSEINKKYFRIFDCVNVYEGISDFTEMKPVTKSTNFKFAELKDIYNKNTDIEIRKNVLERAIDKLNKISKDKLSKYTKEIEILEGNDIKKIDDIFKNKLIFDEFDNLNKKDLFIPVSQHPDHILSVEEDYGDNKNFEDYLEEFEYFIKNNKNKIISLKLATQNPEKIKRSQLIEILRYLDNHNFSEAKLINAYKKKTKAQIVSNIIGYIRQAALGVKLESYSLKVEKAIFEISNNKKWTDTQLVWLNRLGKTIKNEICLDKEYLNTGIFLDQGGFERINKVFDNNLENIIEELKIKIWN